VARKLQDYADDADLDKNINAPKESMEAHLVSS
jgi:hypothetical protein